MFKALLIQSFAGRNVFLLLHCLYLLWHHDVPVIVLYHQTLFLAITSFSVNKKASQWPHSQSWLVGPFDIPWDWDDQRKRETKLRLPIPHGRVSISWVGRDSGKFGEH